MEFFCTEDGLRSRLACLTEEELILFRKACETSQDISIYDVMNAMQMCRYLLGSFEEETDRFCVFEEVREAFNKIDDEEFCEEQNKKGWMVKCIRFFVNYYGVAPLEIIYELYRLKIKDTIDEMIDLLWSMPIDMVECCIFSTDKIGMQDLPKNDPLYSDEGLLIYLPILENEEFGSLLNQQMDKAFYIPSVDQIQEICNMGYEVSAVAPLSA